MSELCSNAEAAERLRNLARRLRRRDLEMVHAAGIGHPGGELSAMDVLATLYLGGVLNVDPRDPAKPDRDRFILSKGHSAAALYATLAEAGFFPAGELATFAQTGSRLGGHPDRTKVPGVESNTGPLGHGLPVGVGCALAAKLDGAEWRTFVLTGDGELQEGSNWEAAMAAAHFKLDNLTVIVDRNRLQLGDSTELTMRLEPLAEKWRAFGWSVVEVDGHDHAALLAAFDCLPFESGRPTCVIANTHKGEGVSFMRDNPAWHHGSPTADQLVQALGELSSAEEAPR